MVRVGDLTAVVLATLHNLRFYLDFMEDLREAIASGTLVTTAQELTAGYSEDERSEAVPRSSNHPVQLP